MEEESDLEIHRRQIIHQLQLVGVQQPVSCFGFDDHTTVHEHIDAMKSNLTAVEKHLDWELTLHDEPTAAECDFQSAHVDPFAKAESQLVIGFEETPNDLMRERLLEEMRAHGALVPVGTIRVHPGNPCSPASSRGTVALRREPSRFALVKNAA